MGSTLHIPHPGHSPSPHRYWSIPPKDYSKNPYLFRNHIIPNEAPVEAQEPRGHRPTQAKSGSCQFGNYTISKWCVEAFPTKEGPPGACFYPITHGMRVTGCWENVHFLTPPFSTDFFTGHGKNVFLVITLYHMPCL